MLSVQEKQDLANRLKNKIKKASSKIETGYQAESGDYKVIITANNVTQFYKGNEVTKVTVAELGDELTNYINNDVEEAAQGMLEEFKASFQPEAFKEAATKEAAHATQDESTWTMTTEKQLDDQKVPLHPRTNESYKNVTQKQLPEHGQRPGTYDVTTEKQLKDETTTFYDAPLTAGQRRNEDRTAVTESQLDDGVKEYSDVATVDRGETGIKYDGGVEKQWHQTGEKQLMELLSHHEWKEPLTITEGSDQLGKQDGELARITAEIAENIIKEALDALGRTVIATGAETSEVAEVAHRLVSHPSKLPALANTLMLYSKVPVSAIEKKVTKAQKLSSTDRNWKNVSTQEWSKNLIADVLVRQLSKIAFSPKFVAECLDRLARRSDFSTKIDATAGNIMIGQSLVKESSNGDIFDQVLNGTNDVQRFGNADDGRYSYVGPLTEVNADPNDRQAFSKAASAFALTKLASDANIGNDVNLVPESCEVNKDKSYFEVIFRDDNKPVETLEARAARRAELAKEAQVGGQGGMPPAAGPELGNPMTPPGGAAGAPPGEALSQEPLPPPGEEEGGAAGEPKPPGSLCPVCGGEDVDVDNGDCRCNNCGGEWHQTINLEITKHPGALPESDESDKPGFGLDEGAEGMGAEDSAMAGPAAGPAAGEGGGTTMPTMPVGASSSKFMEKVANSNVWYGASVKITPLMLNKLAEQKIQLGSVCTNCGGHDTTAIKSDRFKGHEGICWDCNQEYRVKVIASKDKKHDVHAQFAWKAQNPAQSCPSCKRSSLKEAFVKSLKNYGMSWDAFNSQDKSITQKGDIIISMAKANCLDIKEAMTQPLNLDRFRPINKLAARGAQWAAKFDRFPSASCIERIARKFGENATAMSGPCQGKPLHECVCGQLENLGIYTDGLAAKVAKVQISPDPAQQDSLKECVAIFVKQNYDVKEACVACDGLRAAYADEDDLIIETIAQINPYPLKTAPSKPMPLMPSMKTSPKPMSAAPGMKPMMSSPSNGQNIGQPKPMPSPMSAPSPMPSAKPMSAPMNSAPSPMPSGPSPMPMDAGPSPMPAPMHAGPSPMSSPMPKPMGNPMDEPVVDMSNDMSPEMGGSPDMGGNDMGNDGGMGMDRNVDVNFDMQGGSEMGGSPNDMGGGQQGSPVTLNLPPDLANALQETLHILQNALQGNISNDMIDTTGDNMNGDSPESLDMSDVTDGVVDDNGGESNGDSSNGESSDIPGLVEEESNDSLVKSDDPSEGSGGSDSSSFSEHKEDESSDSSGNNPFSDKSDDHDSHSDEHKESDESDEKPMHDKDKQASLETFLKSMKTGSIKKNQDALNSVFDGLLRQAKLAAKTATKGQEVKKVEYTSSGEGSKLSVKPAQDATDIGTIQNNGKIQHEKAFKEGINTKPDVPRAKATMGDEGTEVTISEKSDLPTIPHGAKPMEGEKNNKPEKGNIVDGNQGNKSASNKTVVKTAKCSCTPDCECNKAKPCMGTCGHNKSASTRKSYIVASNHKYYGAFLKQIQAGRDFIQLQDGNTYDMSRNESNTIVLMQQKNSNTIKESQTATPKNVKNLEDDPDINQSSGPGKGKVKSDKPHSLAVDEKKPSEGMNEPSVPEAPNGGQLKNEHNYDTKLEGPTIPAGGGMNSEYDQNEKNKPEKLDQTLGKDNDLFANRDLAIKIAGRMLKDQLITEDELPSKISQLSKVSPDILKDYENFFAKAANETKGLQTKASAGSVESAPILQKTASTQPQNQDIGKRLESLFTLERKNQDYEAYSTDKNTRLYR